MIWRTEMKVEREYLRVSHDTPTVFVGSCFSDSVGERVRSDKIPSMVNPEGVIYNPMSIAKLLTYAMNDSPVESSRIIQRGERYCHLDYHGDIHAQNPDDLISIIGELNRSFRAGLTNASHLMITWGSARVYRYSADDEIVANCHKLPSGQFDRELLSTEEIVQTWSALIKSILEVNPNLQITLTISPVRHIRDGLVENNVSKAHLISAAHALVGAFDSVHYFPAYEMLIDDLRDYRYYADDLVHPSPKAVEYIYEQFSRWCYSDQTMNIIKEVRGIQKAAAHRPFEPDSADHQRFLRKTLDRITAVEEKYNINLSDEAQHIKAQLLG